MRLAVTHYGVGCHTLWGWLSHTMGLVVTHYEVGCHKGGDFDYEKLSNIVTRKLHYE